MMKLRHKTNNKTKQQKQPLTTTKTQCLHSLKNYQSLIEKDNSEMRKMNNLFL